MNTLPNSKLVDFAPSVYLADCFVNCEIGHAWNSLWEFQHWNPTFAGATVTSIGGTPRHEGEILIISKTGQVLGDGAFPEFYCRTVMVQPLRRIVWYAYAIDGQSYQNQLDPFRNFIDFGLEEEPDGVRFSICYYAQNRLSEELLDYERRIMAPALRDLTASFRAYCETPRPKDK